MGQDSSRVRMGQLPVGSGTIIFSNAPLLSVGNYLTQVVAAVAVAVAVVEIIVIVAVVAAVVVVVVMVEVSLSDSEFLRPYPSFSTLPPPPSLLHSFLVSSTFEHSPLLPHPSFSYLPFSAFLPNFRFPFSSLSLLGTYRSRRKGGRAGARALGQDSTSSPNLDALLSRSNLSPYNFLGSAYNEKNSEENLVSRGAESGGLGPGPGLGLVPASSANSLSEAAKRANLMHNMRRIERIELLTNKRRDRL